MPNNNPHCPWNGTRILLTLVCCLTIWGITFALWTSDSEIALIVVLLCAFSGWRSLSMFTPIVFIFAPLTGWLIYLIVKFILSTLIGLFVAPFRIGMFVADWIYYSI